MGRAIQYESETCWFVLVWTLDYLLTYVLLYVAIYSGEPIYEANPIAASLVDSLGGHGMLIYKMAVLAFICWVVQWIAVRKPRRAKQVIWLGIGMYSTVNLYQLGLLVYSTGAFA